MCTDEENICSQDQSTAKWPLLPPPHQRLIHGARIDIQTDGVSELKVDFGPGYRVYYAWRGETLLLLLAGGDKSTQQSDIAKAIQLNRDFNE
ncbi:type II toxin-antitoxin system RelE/ParE family toxin [Lamprocystis purpurea]|jgi:putative addiction module killer protein|uniref:type II toxin-antitoxin system RelE/ParE family toxin n=1 Tax=Lamprocystis purpurea TaxID=61598 RepID=UPI0003682B74|nr:type II toxin-antitoxin system RelE/ParE family toxin [Lamprocystis purpurea]